MLGLQNTKNKVKVIKKRHNKKSVNFKPVFLWLISIIYLCPGYTILQITVMFNIIAIKLLDKLLL